MLENNQDYRELLNEKFTNLHTKLESNFNSLHDIVQRVEAQTTKTNGRVTNLENKIHILEISDATHGLRCPQNHKFDNIGDDIKELKKSFEDVSFFVRHPKLGLAIIVISVILTLFSYLSIYDHMQKIKEENKIENTK